MIRSAMWTTDEITFKQNQQNRKKKLDPRSRSSHKMNQIICLSYIYDDIYDFKTFCVAFFVIIFADFIKLIKRNVL